MDWGTINRIASQDMMHTLQSKQRTEQTLAEVQTINARISSGAIELAAVTQQIESEVNAAVTALQFQDLATQLISYSDGRIELVGKVAGGLARLPQLLREIQPARTGPATTGALDALMADMSAAIESLHSKRNTNPVLQTSMGRGAVELF